MKAKIIAAVIVGVIVLAGGIFYFAGNVQAPPSLQPMPEIPAPTSTAPATLPTSTAPTSTPQSGTYLTPTSGPVGTSVTIHGNGFTGDNTITMNGLTGGAMKDIASSGGTTLTFQVPANLGPNCGPDQACPQFLMIVSARAYTIAVITNGTSENIGTFTVTGGGEQIPR